MKRFLFLSLPLFLFWACSNNDFDDKLEGKWQLRTVQTPNETMVVDTVWYNFQNKLFKYQIYSPTTGGTPICHGFKTVKDDNLLFIELAASPYETKEEMIQKFLPQTDWETTERTFVIEKLKGKELILKDADKTYIFRKF